MLQLIANILTPEIKTKKIPSLYSLEIEFTNKETKLFNNFLELDENGHVFHKNGGSLKNNILKVWQELMDEDFVDSIFYFKKFLQENKLVYKIAYFHSNIFSKNTNNSKKDTSKILNYINYNTFEQDLEKYFQEVIHEYLEQNREQTFAQVTKKRILEINSFLEKLNINTKIHDIERKKLILENFSGEKLQISNLSDGEKQIYFRAIFLNSLNLENSIIMVDEPELSLHPTWQNTVTNLYESAGKDNQIFLATHSPHIISSTKPENLFSLFVNNETKKIEVINLEILNRKNQK